MVKTVMAVLKALPGLFLVLVALEVVFNKATGLYTQTAADYVMYQAYVLGAFLKLVAGGVVYYFFTSWADELAKLVEGPAKKPEDTPAS